MRYITAFALVLVLPISAGAQTLTGTWTGSLVESIEGLELGKGEMSWQITGATDIRGGFSSVDEKGKRVEGTIEGRVENGTLAFTMLLPDPDCPGEAKGTAQVAGGRMKGSYKASLSCSRELVTDGVLSLRAAATTEAAARARIHSGKRKLFLWGPAFFAAGSAIALSVGEDCYDSEQFAGCTSGEKKRYVVGALAGGLGWGMLASLGISEWVAGTRLLHAAQNVNLSVAPGGVVASYNVRW